MNKFCPLEVIGVFDIPVNPCVLEYAQKIHREAMNRVIEVNNELWESIVKPESLMILPLIGADLIKAWSLN